MLNLGIIGHGFVGKAVDYGFTNESVNKIIVDPKYKNSIESEFNKQIPDIIFVCVPTPASEIGKIDSSIIENVVRELEGYFKSKSPLVVIKSTVTPDVIESLSNIYENIVYNPEFLTEANYEHDFINASMHVFGAEKKDRIDQIKFIYEQHSNCNPCPFVEVDLKTASMIKYTLNSFLASKVLFFNQLYKLYINTKTNVSWEEFTKYVSLDKRVGSSHMKVPGPDGQYGFGGNCFPKDTNALVYYSKQMNSDFKLLENVIEQNKNIRG